MLKQNSAPKEAPHFSPAQMKKIDDTAQDFEAVFISQMLEHMFDGVETDPLTGGGEAEDEQRRTEPDR